ncbi:MAG: HdeD family acid-resistance protein [Sphaerochaetaceae bacterium]
MKNKKWLGWLAIGLLLIAAGCFILFQNEAFVRVLVMLLGALAVVNGVIALTAMNRYSLGTFSKNATLVKGILSLVVGILAVVMPIFTAQATWMVFIYVLACQILFSGMVTLLDAFVLRSSNFNVSRMVVEGFVSLIVAVILFLFPQSVGTLLVRILGITVVVVGITVGALSFHIRNKRDSQVLHEPEFEVLSDS